MHFRAEEGTYYNVTIGYDKEDFSFDLIGSERPDGLTTLLLNDLNLEVDDKGKLLYGWGLCPHTSWKTFDGQLHNIVDGQVTLVAEGQARLTPGISTRINKQARWPVYFNEKSGWVCVGEPRSQGKNVRFANNVVATIQLDQIVALWVRLAANPKERC